MTVAELLRRGDECEAAGDLDGAEAAYREADELQDAEGAILLGYVLKRRSDLAAAADAFRRAEERGHPEAGSSLGNLLSETGDLAGAREAYKRSIAAGSTQAVLNLGLTLAQEGAIDEALPYLRRAEVAGPDPAAASWAIGKLLEGRDDFEGAVAPYRRGADGGNVHAAYGLGVVLERLGDRTGARAAMQRARDLGHDGAGKVLEAMEREAVPATVRAAVEAAMKPGAPTEPQPGEPLISPLADGEERLLQTVHRADGHRNDIYLIHRRPTDDETMGTGEAVNFVAVIRSTDADPQDASPPWAWQRGPTERSIYLALAEALVNAPPFPGSSVSTEPEVQWFAERIRDEAGGVPSPGEITQNLAQLYVGACGEVIAAAEACLEAANRAVAGDDEAERGFGPLFTAFNQICTTARKAATDLLSSLPGDPIFVEMRVAMMFEQEALDQLANVKAILGAHFGPTPAAFLQGLAQARSIAQRNSAHPEDGNIYRPSVGGHDIQVPPRTAPA